MEFKWPESVFISCPLWWPFSSTALSPLIHFALFFTSFLLSYKTAVQAYCPLPPGVCLGGLTYEFQGFLKGWQVMKQYVQSELQLGKGNHAFCLCMYVCAQASH